MKTFLAFVVAVGLTGCAVPYTPAPTAVQVMPNDCANRTAIINWLTHQAAIPRQPFESELNYEQSRAQIRHRIWTVRYNCQRV